MFILEGLGECIDKDGYEIKLKPDDILYIPPGDKHQIKNIGNTSMRIICTIPILPGGDGKKTIEMHEMLV
jgi:mannose-6-phosphate isomerase-like protein (cupin superfamily)